MLCKGLETNKGHISRTREGGDGEMGAGRNSSEVERVIWRGLFPR